MMALGKSSNAQVTINTVRNFSGVGGLDGSLDDADGTANGIFTVSGNLTIACGGSIVCNDPAAPTTAGACPIRINVTGDGLLSFTVATRKRWLSGATMN